MSRRLKPPFGLLVAIAVTLVAVGLLRRPPPRPTVTEVSRAALELRDGRLCRKGEAAPFTGLVVEFDAQGTRRSSSQVREGLLAGVSEGWHTNGQLQVREHFVAGVSHGLRSKWHLNGRLLSEATIVNGQMEGTFRRWDEQGNLTEEVPMKAGQPDGVARSYHSSGCLKAEVRLQSGQVIEQQYWKDGERPDPALTRSEPQAAGNP